MVPKLAPQKSRCVRCANSIASYDARKILCACVFAVSLPSFLSLMYLCHLCHLEIIVFRVFLLHFQHQLALVAVVVLVVIVLAHRLSKLFSGTWVGGFPPFNVLSAIRLSMCWRPPASQYCRLAAFHSVVGLPSFGVGGFPPLFGMRRCHLAFSAPIKTAVKK